MENVRESRDNQKHDTGRHALSTGRHLGQSGASSSKVVPKRSRDKGRRGKIVEILPSRKEDRYDKRACAPQTKRMRRKRIAESSSDRYKYNDSDSRIGDISTDRYREIDERWESKPVSYTHLTLPTTPYV